MEEFTIDEVIGFHIELIQASNLEEDRGFGGVLLQRGNLEYVINTSNNIFEPFERAAFILHGLVTGHPFVQGNKRISFILASLSLLRTPERYHIESSGEEIDSFVREIAQGKKTKDDVETWLRINTKKR
jgi:death-on-curing protein